MNEIIIQLMNAIQNIENRYFERNEREFAYELYHQMRMNKYPDNVEITCETGKKRFNFYDDIFRDNIIYRNFFRENQAIPNFVYRVPDLLIHEYDNRNQQLIAVEIKRKPSETTVLRDLSKLVAYCRGNLRYQKGVLIIFRYGENINFNRREIREILIRYPEIEIWIIRTNPISIEIICSTNLNLL
jgi:hypothetical protein